MTDKSNSNILKLIAQKEAELAEIKSKLNDAKSSQKTKRKIVEAPKAIESYFDKVLPVFEKYYKEIKLNPEKGSIHINGERYVLMRSDVISYQVFQSFLRLYKVKTKAEAFELTSDLLFDFSHIMGYEDAKRFHEKMNVTDPLYKLSSGPIHFAYTGWANVEILDGSNPVVSKDFVLKFRHKSNFEAEAWLRNNGGNDQNVCIMNAGYSSGWCSAAFGIDLTSVEVSCTATGDKYCEFIMAPPDRIQYYIDAFVDEHKPRSTPIVPNFFERNAIEVKLKESQEMFKDTQRIAKMGSWKFFFNNEELYWSEGLYEMFEFKDIKGAELFQRYLNCFDTEDQKKIKYLMERSVIKQSPFQLRNTISVPSGEKKWIYTSAIPIFNDKKQVVGLKGSVRDITEEVLRGREVENFFELSADLQCIANMDGYFVKVSPSWTRLLGYTEDELLNQPFVNFVHPEDKNKTADEVSDIKSKKKAIYNFENRYIKKNGEIVRLSWNSSIDEVTGLIYSTARDITEQNKKKERLLSDLSEKEVLLREIHHRVKNNLQIISSLLSLQSNLSNVSEDIKKLYDDSQNRIKSMASIHELFYKSETLDKLNFESYVKKLVGDLNYTYSGHQKSVSIDVDLKNVYLNLDLAIPLGLIINEIISNALKYGFDKVSSQNRIDICCLKKNKAKFTMLIGDNGKGCPNILSEKYSNSLGITIITSLVEQIDGEIKQVKEDEGTYFELSFKLNNEVIQ